MCNSANFKNFTMQFFSTLFSSGPSLNLNICTNFSLQMNVRKTEELSQRIQQGNLSGFQSTLDQQLRSVAEPTWSVSME